jgi:hypothetical protein
VSTIARNQCRYVLYEHVHDYMYHAQRRPRLVEASGFVNLTLPAVRAKIMYRAGPFSTSIATARMYTLRATTRLYKIGMFLQSTCTKFSTA